MGGKINVAIISFPIGELGGAFGVYRNWLATLDKSTFNVHFITYSVRYGEMEEQLQQVADIKTVNIEGLNKWYLIYIPGIISLVRYLKKNEIDIVHTSLLQADIMGSLSGKLAGVPVIISTVVGHLINTNSGLKGKIKNVIYKTVYNIVQQWFSKIITISKATSDEMIREFKVDQKKMEVNYCGIELPKIKPTRANCDKPYTTIGVIGEIIPPKGMGVFIEAIPLIVREYPNTRFLVAGEGSQKNALEERVDSLGLGDRVHFMGWVDNPREVIRSMDIFVFPSLPNYDGLPRVILEAWSVETPVIAANVACVPELFKDKNVGTVIEPNSPGAIYKAVKDLMDEPQKAKQMSENARNDIDKFDKDVEVRWMESTYISLIKNAKRATI